MFAIFAVLLAAALPATSALASRTPTKSEKTALKKAVKKSHAAPKWARKGHFKLSKIRVSDSGRWAAAVLGQTNGYTDPFAPPKGLFKHGGGGWKLVKYGTKVGCKKPKLARSVRKQLKLKC
jgi:hypothetical protein